MYQQSENKLVKQRYLPHMSSQYGELQPTNGWDPFGSLWHPSKFQRVSHLGSVTAWHCSGGRQPNFVSLNRVRHLYSAGCPSCWALAHILVMNIVHCLKHQTLLRLQITSTNMGCVCIFWCRESLKNLHSLCVWFDKKAASLGYGNYLQTTYNKIGIFLAILYTKNCWHWITFVEVIMAALCNRGAIIFLPCDFYLSSIFLLFFIPCLISAAAGWMSTILWHMVWP